MPPSDAGRRLKWLATIRAITLLGVVLINMQDYSAHAEPLEWGWRCITYARVQPLRSGNA